MITWNSKVITYKLPYGFDVLFVCYKSCFKTQVPFTFGIGKLTFTTMSKTDDTVKRQVKRQPKKGHHASENKSHLSSAVIVTLLEVRENK